MARLSPSVPPLVKTIFGSAASEKLRHRFAGMLDRGAGLLSMMVDGRRVAEVLGEVRAHGLEDFGKHRRGGVIVEVDAAHTAVSILRWRRLGPRLELRHE